MFCIGVVCQLQDAIVGISVGGAAVVGLAAALFFFVGRARTLQDIVGRRQATVQGQTWTGAGNGRTVWCKRAAVMQVGCVANTAGMGDRPSRWVSD